MSKLTKADAKRIQDLKIQVDVQKKKNEDEKKKLLKLKKELDNEKKKIANGWKDLKNAQKQLANDKKFLDSHSSKQKAKESRKSTGGGQWQAKYMDMKKTADREGKQSRDYKKRIDQLEAEMKILKRKLKNLAGRKSGKEDPRIKSLTKENKMLKKKLRMLMKELNKKRRWFQRTIKLFKANQNAWIKKQQDAFKNKKFIIKYVFLDDVKRITQYGRPGKDKWRFKNKIKVRTKGGGEVVLKDIEIMILDGTFNDDLENDDTSDKNSKSKKKKSGKNKKGGDNDDDDDATKKKKKKGKKKGDIDDEDGTIVGESEEDNGKGSKKKKKGGKKTAEDYEDEIEQYMAELENEFGLMNDEAIGDDDDYKTDPELDKIDDIDMNDDDDDDDDTKGDKDGDDDGDDGLDDMDSGGSEELSAQILALNQESESRNEDLKKLQEILNDKESNPDPVAAAKELAEAIEKRQESVADNLKSLNASSGTIDNFKEHGNNYASFILNLSKSIAGNSVNFDKLCQLCDYFNKELQGRINDLNKINEIYYNEFKKDDDNDKPPFDILKEGVDERHNDIDKSIQEELGKDQDAADDDNKEDAKDPDDPDANSKKETSENGERVKEIYDKLLINNKDYNEALGESSGKYDTAQNEKAKLVSEFYSRYQAVENLIQKINNVPSTKIDLDNNDDNNDNNQDNDNAGDDNNEQNDVANDEDEI